MLPGRKDDREGRSQLPGAFIVIRHDPANRCNLMLVADKRPRIPPQTPNERLLVATYTMSSGEAPW